MQTETCVGRKLFAGNERKVKARTKQSFALPIISRQLIKHQSSSSAELEEMNGIKLLYSRYFNTEQKSLTYSSYRVPVFVFSLHDTQV
jgi:hypothetical protein